LGEVEGGEFAEGGERLGFDDEGGVVLAEWVGMYVMPFARLRSRVNFCYFYGSED
jgi:hypothetical protein